MAHELQSWTSVLNCFCTILELDLLVGECARTDSDDKIVIDEGELAREAKDSFDVIIVHTDEMYNAIGYAIYTAGPCMSISTIQLGADGLYVSKHRYTYTINRLNNDLL